MESNLNELMSNKHHNKKREEETRMKRNPPLNVKERNPRTSPSQRSKMEGPIDGVNNMKSGSFTLQINAATENPTRKH